MKKWSSMDKGERLAVFMYALEVADREKEFEDGQSEILKKEIKRIDGLHRYNGCYPLIFNDDYGISANFAYTQKGTIVTEFNNAKGQGELGATLQLLYQAKFNFDERNFDDSKFMYIMLALSTIDAREFFRGLALYLKKNKTPKVIKDLY